MADDSNKPEPFTEMAIIDIWFRTDKAMVMYLSDGTLQVRVVSFFDYSIYLFIIYLFICMSFFHLGEGRGQRRKCTTIDWKELGRLST